MKLKSIFIIMAVCTGCISSESGLSQTPDFVTAVLPSAQIGQATSTAAPPAPVINNTESPTVTVSIEGTTTAEINVRAQPTTASAALGLIGIFTKVQIVGQDTAGSWYQIRYADSLGWVRAEYVQVNTRDGIPVAAAATRSAAGGSGFVIQKINVRKGPGTNFESLGVLNPNDVIFIIGKDPSGAWAQIEFANAPDGKGWTAVEFLKIDNVDSLPIIGAAEQTTDIPASAETLDLFSVAMQDSDSRRAPLTTVIFSLTNARSLQVNNDISVNGDAEDWLEFTSSENFVLIKVACSNSGVRVELWNNEIRVADFLLACGSEKLVPITPSSDYFLGLFESTTDEFHYTNYILTVDSFH